MNKLMMTPKDLYEWAMMRGKTEVPICIYVMREDNQFSIVDPALSVDMLETREDVGIPECKDYVFINVGVDPSDI